MKLSTYQEGLLKDISSEEERQIYRSVLEKEAKCISQYQLFIEEDSGQYPKIKDHYLHAIKSAQARISRTENLLSQLKKN